MPSLVSIIIPIYNVEKYVVSCLESVYNQKYKNIEVILVDDRGTDNSINVINQYFKEHPEYTYTLVQHATNSGLSVARNTGLNKANGEYIFFLDSDDTLPDKSIQFLQESAIRYMSDVVIGEIVCIEEISGIKKNPFPLQVQTEFLANNKEIITAFFKGAWPVIAPNKLYKREFLLQHKLMFEPHLLHEDELWSFVWVLKAQRVSIIHEVTYNYIFHQSSIIFNKKEANTDDIFFISEKMYSYYLREQDKYKKQQIYFYLIKFSEQNLRIAFQHIRKKEYFKKIYLQTQKNIKFSFTNYFNTEIPTHIKRLSLMMHLPSELGYRLYRYRFDQKISSFFKK